MIAGSLKILPAIISNYMYMETLFSDRAIVSDPMLQTIPAIVSNHMETTKALCNIQLLIELSTLSTLFLLFLHNPGGI